MNKEKLKELKEKLELLEQRTNELKNKKQQFEEENIELIEHINQLNTDITNCKDILRENAETGFLQDGNKKRLGGIGIRVGTALVYDINQALSWAKEHSLCLSLDKRAFEKIAKTQDIDFVDMKERITVTFPSVIDLGDEE